MTRLAFVVSLLVHRSLDGIRATSPAIVARELLPGSSLVLARFRQVSDHHTGVSFAELVKCAGAILPILPILPIPSIRAFQYALLEAYWHFGLSFNGLA
jgi:hypothetical protein